VAVAAYVVPGAQTKNEHLVDAIAYILGLGKGSRLYKKLVNEEQLVTSFSAYPFSLFEAGIFLMSFEPKDINDLPKIYDLIQEEIDSIIKDGLSDLEYNRALNQARMSYYNLLESIETQAREIGRAYLATGDENFAFHFMDKPKKEAEVEIKKLLAAHFKNSVMHKGTLLPLSEQDKKEWQALQKASDEYDTKFLAKRSRTTPIEPPHYAKTLKVNEATKFDFPKYKTITLKNGLKVLYYDNASIPKIDLVMELKARHYYDSQSLPGLYNFVSQMLSEGTKKYTAGQLADELESRGMDLQVTPGTIALSMLATDFEKGLELLLEIVENPRFDEKEIEIIQSQPNLTRNIPQK